MGIEPTHARATIWCVNHFTTPAIILLTRAVGIEPTLKVLETLVLPLNYARKMEGEGFEPPNPKERIYSPPRLASSLPFRISNCAGGIRTPDLEVMSLASYHCYYRALKLRILIMSTLVLFEPCQIGYLQNDSKRFPCHSYLLEPYQIECLQN